MAGLTADEAMQARRELDELEEARASARKDDWKYMSRQKVEDQDPTCLDGLPEVKVKAWRRQILKVLSNAGIALRIPQWGIATAAVLCQRFYSRRSMKRNDRFTIAMACLHLAAKMEESPKPVRDIIRECRKVVSGGKPPDSADEVERLREEVLTAERAVLYTLKFDLGAGHPYRFLVHHLSSLGLLQANAQPESPYRKLMQNTWNLVNDSFRTTLCLQYPPDKVAAAALYLANLLNVRMYGQPGDIMTHVADKINAPQITFFQHFGVTSAEVHDISQQILELYKEVKGTGYLGDPPSGASPRPTFSPGPPPGRPST